MVMLMMYVAESSTTQGVLSIFWSTEGVFLGQGPVVQARGPAGDAYSCMTII